jgi:pimeloyl-ACP methyl ester carboxylesterase
MTTLTDTIDLPCVERGDRDGVPVLMLHGWSDSWRSYEPVLPYLPERLRAIVPTQRGHGDAERPADGYAPRDLAADAVALLDTLEVERAVVVGHSMGAWVAERVAIDHPDRVAGLILAGAIGPADANPVAGEVAREAMAFEDPVDPEWVREFQVSTTELPLAPAQLDTFVAESLKLPARVWRATAAGFPHGDLYGELAAIEAPTTLIWGDRDSVGSRAEQLRIAAAIPGARLIVYAGIGHAIHWEQPERFAADVVAFAAEVTS